MSYINKVLIANRGEIACRVMRTAKKMGIKTVAVYSDIDRESLFVQQADEAYHIGGSPALQSYLKADKIIEVALHSKAQAIHPGFGFLSENANFARDCQKNQLIFVGPPADAITKMGSKSESKYIMTSAGVPVVPGYHGENQSNELLLEESRKIGFPVLIKAIMGGGGKGMRIVREERDFKEALEGARRESMKAFRDDRVLVEKYIQQPRHIEVQIFGDSYGNYVHFFDRDCSIQRRHQKVIEEAPSALNEKLSSEIGEKAKEAAKAVKYTNAGTVEFIFDLATNEYFFMEMNTRLQVEHPISEMITGTDLVEWQFRVASGEKLPKTQDQIKKNGYSIEARIYSESPQNDFLPGNGRLNFYREPKDSGDGNIRIESGVRENDEISIFYDPMIAKLVVWGETRQQAILRLSNSLQQYRIIGLPNNIRFLKQILNHPEYIGQDYDTSFIQQHKDQLLALKPNYSNLDIAVALVVPHYQQSLTLGLPNGLRSFRNNIKVKHIGQASISSEHYEKHPNMIFSLVCGANDTYDVHINDTVVSVYSIKQRENKRWLIRTDEGIFERDVYIDTNRVVHVFDQDGDPFAMDVISDHIEEDLIVADTSSLDFIKAPMPCTLAKVNFKIGDQVKKGDTLLIMEAMKMEHTVKASRDGVVKEVNYQEGQFVEHGKIIMRIE